MTVNPLPVDPQSIGVGDWAAVIGVIVAGFGLIGLYFTRKSLEHAKVSFEEDTKSRDLQTITSFHKEVTELEKSQDRNRNYQVFAVMYINLFERISFLINKGIINPSMAGDLKGLFGDHFGAARELANKLKLTPDVIPSLDQYCTREAIEPVCPPEPHPDAVPGKERISVGFSDIGNATEAINSEIKRLQDNGHKVKDVRLSAINNSYTHFPKLSHLSYVISYEERPPPPLTLVLFPSTVEQGETYQVYGFLTDTSVSGTAPLVSKTVTFRSDPPVSIPNKTTDATGKYIADGLQAPSNVGTYKIQSHFEGDYFVGGRACNSKDSPIMTLTVKMASAPTAANQVSSASPAQ